MNTPFERLVYIYVATSNYSADYNFYRNILGAKLVWEFENFGAKVAAFNLGNEPYILIADHVPAPAKRLIYEVKDLKKTIAELTQRGWKPDGKPFEVPDGTCINFKDESGNEYALLQMTRPYILNKEFEKKKD